MRRSVRQHGQGQEGLTLIELAVVGAISLILIAFAIPRLWGAMTQAKATRGTVDITAIAGALERYRTDYAAYPKGANAAAITTALKGYLPKGATYTNGFGRGYLYLTSTNGTGFYLIDLQQEQQDDDSGKAGQQIKIRCKNGANTQDRNYTVSTGLTLPTETTWMVPDTHIKDCWPVTGGLAIKIIKNM